MTDISQREQRHRIQVGLLVVSWLLFCWYAMQLLHEAGHAFAALCLDIEIVQFHFGLLTISHTMLDEAGQSSGALLAATWAGPVVGMLLPLAMWGVAAILRFHEAFLLRFLAGFCLVANGCYLLCGPSSGYADTAVLLAHGAMRRQLLFVGLIGVIVGFALWNGQGQYFGIGKNPQPIGWRSVCFSVVCLIVMTAFAMLNQ